MVLVSRFAFVSDAVIEGLVLGLETPLQPRLVDIVVDGTYFGSQYACEVVDVRELHFIGEEAFARLRTQLGTTLTIAAKFRFEFNSYVSTADEHRFELIDHHAETLLFGETRSLRKEFDAHLARAFENVLRGRLYVGSVEGRRVEFGGTLIVTGDESGIAARGHSTTDFHFERTPSTDSGNDAVLPQSRCFDIRGEAEIGDAGATVELFDPDGRIIIPRSSALVIGRDFAQDLRDWANPEDFRMRRTMGFAAPLSYYFDGYQTLCALDSASQEFCGAGLRSYRSILDWGCGCGRVTQHLVRSLPAAIHGADIDSDSLSWCRSNIPKAKFEHAGLVPPLDFPDGSMDLVIGISVFTHLDEASQRAWLAEISRLLEPGGVAMLTIMSEHALFNRWMTPAAYRDFVERGISDGTVGGTLRDVLVDEDGGYYRETYQSHDYVLRNWGGSFDILGIKRAAYSNFQDLVVMKKRARSVSPRIGF